MIALSRFSWPMFAEELILKIQKDLQNPNSIEARVTRLLARELDIKQLRVDEAARKIDVGFYREPSRELLRRN